MPSIPKAAKTQRQPSGKTPITLIIDNKTLERLNRMATNEGFSTAQEILRIGGVAMLKKFGY